MTGVMLPSSLRLSAWYCAAMRPASLSVLRASLQPPSGCRVPCAQRLPDGGTAYATPIRTRLLERFYRSTVFWAGWGHTNAVSAELGIQKTEV